MRLSGDMGSGRRGRDLGGAFRGICTVIGFAAGAGALLAGCGPQAPTASVAPPSLQPTNQTAELCSAANVVGVGLKAEYFAGAGWQGKPELVRTDASIDFVGAADLPESMRSALPRSIRWSGWIKAPTDGVYRFHVQPAQARVVISSLDMQATKPDAKGLDMVAGRFYPITVEVDQVDAAKLPVRLEWTAPHGARYVIPRALLNLPTETVSVPRSG